MTTKTALLIKVLYLYCVCLKGSDYTHNAITEEYNEIGVLHTASQSITKHNPALQLNCFWIFN